MSRARKYILLAAVLLLTASASYPEDPSYSVMPYAFYDTTIGTSYGLFGAGKNYFKSDELAMLILYGNQSAGWMVQSIFSFPDRSDRYRTLFPLALDLDIKVGTDVDDRFYGFGSATPLDNYSTYNNNYNNIKIVFSKPLSRDLVLESGINLVSNYYDNISQGVNAITPDIAEKSKRYYILNLGAKVHHKDNLLHPQEGEDIYLNFDFGIKGAGSQADFVRAKLDYSKFWPLFEPGHVLAWRFNLTGIRGASIPLYEYATLGGRDNLRGYPWYRFRGNYSVLSNLEYRFPLPWSFGGVLFLDAGKVLDRSDPINLENLATDIGFGLRYFMTDLILRFDYGMGKEENNIYFYYNHAF